MFVLSTESSGSSSGGGGGATSSGQVLGSSLDTISNAVDMLNSIQSIQSRLDPTERLHSRSVSLREMMRRATSAARAVSGLDMRDPEREDSSSGGMAIPTLSWPPDPPSYEAIRSGKDVWYL